VSSYSFIQLVGEALRGNRGWKPAWASGTPKPLYDVVVIGAGGHGLATAYYLAKKHGVRRVAVLEKGWIGGGNSGRNTQVTRSNYFYPVSSAFYDNSLQLYEGLGRELNFNVMLSQRGLIALAHSEHELELNRRWAGAVLDEPTDRIPRSEVRPSGAEPRSKASQRDPGLRKRSRNSIAYLTCGCSLGQQRSGTTITTWSQ
jgi:sarcosine oxidase, subunit beta